MRKYLKIFQVGLQNDLTYRANFVLWRIRQVIVFLVPFYVWSTLLGNGNTLYGYSLTSMLTYLFGSILLRSLVFGSRTVDLAGIINSGNLSLYLLKPINIFKYWFTRDLSDKLLNLSFIFIEFPLLILILRPPIFIQTNIIPIIQTIIAVLVAIALYFYINFLFGTIGFWSKEIWASRFLLFIIMQFATGGMLPLDMLPQPLQNILYLTPFPYLLFFPLKTYLASNTYYFPYLAMSIIWLIIFRKITAIVWEKGLKRYEAEGR